MQVSRLRLRWSFEVEQVNVQVSAPNVAPDRTVGQ